MAGIIGYKITDSCKVMINCRSAFSGIVTTKKLDIDFRKFESDLKKYFKGSLIQDAFPYLSPEDRELIKTGITDEEWKTL